MNKLLLKEIRLWNTQNFIIEDASEGFQKIFMKGKLQEAEALNQNERYYPQWILEREVENFQKKIVEKRSTGELDHPADAVVSLAKVSHIIREIWWQGKEVWGRVEVFNGPDPYGTGSGRIIETLCRRGVTLGISSRGVGSTERDHEGREVVQSDYQLITWDFVSDPSTYGAFLVKEGYSGLSRPLTLDENKLIKNEKVRQVLSKILKG